MTDVDDWAIDAMGYSRAVAHVLGARNALHEQNDSLPELFHPLYEVVEYFAHVERPSRHGRSAVAVICNQTMNDFVEVLVACESGAGRSAVRASRSMLEHAANLAAVLFDSTLDQRYLDHVDASQSSWGALSAVGEHLVGNAGKSDRHHRRKALRDGTKRLEALIQQYGVHFLRQWHPTDLRTRVVSLGWPNHYYEYYRLSSALVHGAAYGHTGLSKSIDGMWVNRIGPAWQICPDALLYSLLYFERAAEVYAASFGRAEPVDRLSGTLSWARREWHHYRAAALKADEELWPKSPPLNCYSVVALAPHGLRRWFVASPDRDIYAAGVEPPDLSPEVRRVIDEAHRQVNDGQVILPVQQGQPTELTTIAVHEVTSIPVEGAVWRRTDGLFGPSLRPSGWIQELGGEATLRHRFDGREI